MIELGRGLSIVDGVLTIKLDDTLTYVSYAVSQSLTDEQKALARANIGAGTSDFSGSYPDLTQKPILNTSNTTSQTAQADETIDGTINLHKVSKTGALADTIQDSTHRTVTDTEKENWNNSITSLRRDLTATQQDVANLQNEIGDIQTALDEINGEVI